MNSIIHFTNEEYINKLKENIKDRDEYIEFLLIKIKKLKEKIYCNEFKDLKPVPLMRTDQRFPSYLS